MSDEYVVPLAPGIFVDRNPAIAAVKKGSKWELVYLTDKGHFLSTGTTYQHPAPKQEVTIEGAWAAPPAQPATPGLTQISATNPIGLQPPAPQ